MIEQATADLLNKKDLSSDLMQQVMEEIMSGALDTVRIVSFLKALSDKGESADEVFAGALVLRQHVTKIKSDALALLDTCGTGGDEAGTFNISTIAAFVASAAGVVVAKHGNRSVSSRCGSADILEAAGININLSKERIEKCLSEIGISFLFAQNLHPAMKYAMPARKEIGKKTIFNILGPLSNPAQAKHQLIGVYEERWTKILAEVLVKLGSSHALVVHGEDGLDEITTTGKTSVYEVKAGIISDYELSPEEFGIRKTALRDLSGSDPLDNVKIMLSILSGEKGPKRDIVVLNAAAAIYAADKANSIKQGIILANQAIDSGKAFKKLELLKDYSTRS